MALTYFCPQIANHNYWNIWDGPERIRNRPFPTHFDYDLFSMLPKRCPFTQTSGWSSIRNDDNKFQVQLDVSHFKPEEITIKTVNNMIEIHGKHEERMDEHGWVSREFTRKYSLPEGCDSKRAFSNLTSSGLLIVETPKEAIEQRPANERVVPIT